MIAKNLTVYLAVAVLTQAAAPGVTKIKDNVNHELSLGRCASEAHITLTIRDKSGEDGPPYLFPQINAGDKISSLEMFTGSDDNYQPVDYSKDGDDYPRLPRPLPNPHLPGPEDPTGLPREKRRVQILRYPPRGGQEQQEYQHQGFRNRGGLQMQQHHPNRCPQNLRLYRLQQGPTRISICTCFCHGCIANLFHLTMDVTKSVFTLQVKAAFTGL
ncbi:hypothetical protein DSO57_1023898 [Entomophthora muscae]|uniref:Uncharacterized protein n=1 Tax=Entomophthora muscae TaxID=34485 RepID=A0ACC2SFL5_9FUNG|nr:hypothetical protein DSO57_1023898 [Entomophthora muscae]